MTRHPSNDALVTLSLVLRFLNQPKEQNGCGISMVIMAERSGSR